MRHISCPPLCPEHRLKGNDQVIDRPYSCALIPLSSNLGILLATSPVPKLHFHSQRDEVSFEVSARTSVSIWRLALFLKLDSMNRRTSPIRTSRSIGVRSPSCASLRSMSRLMILSRRPTFK